MEDIKIRTAIRNLGKQLALAGVKNGVKITLSKEAWKAFSDECSVGSFGPMATNVRMSQIVLADECGAIEVRPAKATDE